MNFYIPSYEECLEIVENNPSMYFIERKFIIDNYNISIFGYRYAKYNNFMIPIISKPYINALEMKGICFVFNDDGTIFKHYVMLHKFWELNQYQHSKYELFNNKKIKNITTKEDGFLFSFLKLPNNKIIPFNKHGFFDDQHLEVVNFLDNKNYYNFINYCLNNNIQPLFEYIGSKLYVNYGNKKDLILLKLRNNLTGQYLNINEFNTKGISIIEEKKETFNEIIELAKTLTNIEGWVVHFNDDTMLKVKTNWWIKLKK
jgi:hypothetical protein